MDPPYQETGFVESNLPGFRRSGYRGAPVCEPQEPVQVEVEQFFKEPQETGSGLVCDWAARGDAICMAAEAKHQRVMCTLTTRLHSLQAE
eukprot:g21218.t1